jgi:hypothetical protein
MSGDRFWTTATDRHQRLAEEYYQNVEVVHPPSVTSTQLCPCLQYSHYCGRAASTVQYYAYRGPAL